MRITGKILSAERLSNDHLVAIVDGGGGCTRLDLERRLDGFACEVVVKVDGVKWLQMQPTKDMVSTWVQVEDKAFAQATAETDAKREQAHIAALKVLEV